MRTKERHQHPLSLVNVAKLTLCLVNVSKLTLSLSLYHVAKLILSLLHVVFSNAPPLSQLPCRLSQMPFIYLSSHIAKISPSLLHVAKITHFMLSNSFSSCSHLNLDRIVFRFITIRSFVDILQRKQARNCFLEKVQVKRQDDAG